MHEHTHATAHTLNYRIQLAPILVLLYNHFPWLHRFISCAWSPVLPRPSHRQHDHTRSIPDGLLDHLAGSTDVGRLVGTYCHLYQRYPEPTCRRWARKERKQDRPPGDVEWWCHSPDMFSRSGIEVLLSNDTSWASLPGHGGINRSRSIDTQSGTSHL